MPPPAPLSPQSSLQSDENATSNVLSLPEIKLQPGSTISHPVETKPHPVETIPNPVETIPNPVETLPNPVDNVPNPVETKPQPEVTMPLSVETKPQPEVTMPLSVETKPQPETTISHSVEIKFHCVETIPPSEETISHPVETKPQPGATIPLSVETIPHPVETILHPVETKPQPGATVPLPVETISQCAETTPQSIEIVHESVSELKFSPGSTYQDSVASCVVKTEPLDYYIGAEENFFPLPTNLIKTEPVDGSIKHELVECSISGVTLVKSEGITKELLSTERVEPQGTEIKIQCDVELGSDELGSLLAAANSSKLGCLLGPKVEGFASNIATNDCSSNICTQLTLSGAILRMIPAENNTTVHAGLQSDNSLTALDGAQSEGDEEELYRVQEEVFSLKDEAECEVVPIIQPLQNYLKTNCKSLPYLRQNLSPVKNILKAMKDETFESISSAGDDFIKATMQYPCGHPLVIILMNLQKLPGIPKYFSIIENGSTCSIEIISGEFNEFQLNKEIFKDNIPEVLKVFESPQITRQGTRKKRSLSTETANFSLRRSSRKKASLESDANACSVAKRTKLNNSGLNESLPDVELGPKNNSSNSYEHGDTSNEDSLSEHSSCSIVENAQHESPRKAMHNFKRNGSRGGTATEPIASARSSSSNLKQSRGRKSDKGDKYHAMCDSSDNTNSTRRKRPHNVVENSSTDHSKNSSSPARKARKAGRLLATIDTDKSPSPEDEEENSNSYIDLVQDEQPDIGADFNSEVDLLKRKRADIEHEKKLLMEKMKQFEEQQKLIEKMKEDLRKQLESKNSNSVKSSNVGAISLASIEATLSLNKSPNKQVSQAPSVVVEEAPAAVNRRFPDLASSKSGLKATAGPKSSLRFFRSEAGDNTAYNNPVNSNTTDLAAVRKAALLQQSSPSSQSSPSLQKQHETNHPPNSSVGPTINKLSNVRKGIPAHSPNINELVRQPLQYKEPSDNSNQKRVKMLRGLRPLQLEEGFDSSGDGLSTAQNLMNNVRGQITTKNLSGQMALKNLSGQIATKNHLGGHISMINITGNKTNNNDSLRGVQGPTSKATGAGSLKVDPLLSNKGGTRPPAAVTNTMRAMSSKPLMSEKHAFAARPHQSNTHQGIDDNCDPFDEEEEEEEEDDDDDDDDIEIEEAPKSRVVLGKVPLRDDSVYLNMKPLILSLTLRHPLLTINKGNTIVPCLEVACDDVTLFACPECYYQTNCRYRYRIHYYIHSYTQYKCNLCEYSSTSREKTLQHEVRHGMDKEMRCPDCNYVCFESKGLMRHRKIHLAPTETDPRCKQCPYVGQSFLDIRRHVITEHGIKGLKLKLECPLCPNQRFATFVLLAKHVDTHINAKGDYTCSHCAFIDPDQMVMQDHVRLHSKVSYFQCDSCSFQSNTRKLLLDHIPVHRPPDQLKCTQCQHTATNKAELENHMSLLHANELYTCNLCDFNSHSLSELLNHKKRKHMNIGAQEPEVCCPACKKFKTNRNCDMKKHLLMQHDFHGEKLMTVLNKLYKAEFRRPKKPSEAKQIDAVQRLENVLNET